MIEALQKVFQKPLYLLLTFITSLTVFVFAVWFPNISLIVKTMGHPGVPFSQKLDLPISLLGSITTNFTLLSASYTIAIAVLFGINLAMIIYFLRQRIGRARQKGVATGFFGLASGVVGMGCAACGSLLVFSIFSLVGVSWILLYLPLNGGEFGILGVILLVISLFLVAKRISSPLTCK